ncbi:hypothetical protein AB0K05_26930 [Nonomuraea sp. NPDC049486]|uniref:hypothetical protein n=1 Tax=Nonomuraea sp. NPDC049486 TaxID=3155773 RepID=UPI0033770E5C
MSGSRSLTGFGLLAMEKREATYPPHHVGSGAGSRRARGDGAAVAKSAVGTAWW